MTGIDLLPREFREAARRRRALAGVVVVLLLVAASLAAARIELSHQVADWESRRSSLEAERARLARVAEKKAEVARLEKLLEEGAAAGRVAPWGELLWYLAVSTPPGVVLQELRGDGQAISLSGQAEDLVGVAVMTRALEACPYLEQVAVGRLERADPSGRVAFTASACWRSR